MEKTLCCLVCNDGCTGIRANTQDSMEEPEDHAPPPLAAPESPPEPDEYGSRRAAAEVRTMHPPAFLARISAPITQKTSAIISDVRGLYFVPDGDQAPGVESDGYRVGLKHKVADISRSQYEFYSFATRHNLSEASVDELLDSKQCMYLIMCCNDYLFIMASNEQ